MRSRALVPNRLLYYTVPIQRYSMLFQKLNPELGQPLYLQLMQQIQHAAETGILRDGDQLPGIRTLAEELVVSPNTIVKAYTELEHCGVLELRQGLGAFVKTGRRTRSIADRVQLARRRFRNVIDNLRAENLRDDEIQRAFEAELLIAAEASRKK